MTADRWALVLGLVGMVLTTVGFLMSFLTAPLVSGAEVDEGALIGGALITNKLLFSQKIFYFHVPVAIVSFFFMFLTAYYGVRFLRTKEKRWDTCAKTTTSIALVFIVGVMVMGVPWTRSDWGVWWVWEPRLITYLILMLLVIGYFIMRVAIDDEERRATYASVFGIIAFIDVPICYAITRIVPNSMHPVVFRTDSGLPPDMLVPFLLSMFGMLMVAFALYRLLLRINLAQERVDALKEALELSDAAQSASADEPLQQGISGKDAASLGVSREDQ